MNGLAPERKGTGNLDFTSARWVGQMGRVGPREADGRAVVARVADCRRILTENMYDDLIKFLEDKGACAFFQKPGQLVISTSFPNAPSANSFWVTRKGNTWYLSTWLPAAYRIPAVQDVGEVCFGILQSSQKAIYRVDDNCITKYDLEPIADAEIDRLLDKLADGA